MLDEEGYVLLPVAIRVPKCRYGLMVMACSANDELSPKCDVGEAQGDQEMPPCVTGFLSVRRTGMRKWIS